MKSQKCEVKFVDDLDMDFKVNCFEIKMIYKIYGKTKTKGYELLTTKDTKDKAIEYINNLDKNTYIGKLIIGHDIETDTDIPIDFER